MTFEQNNVNPTAESPKMSARAFFLWLAFIVITSIYSNPALSLTEEELKNSNTTRLFRYMEEQGDRDILETDSDTRIFYQRFDKDCNGIAVFIVPGWSEPFLKYAETIHDLRRANLCVYTYDHRGQGMSTRYLENTQIGHVNSFSDYIHDLNEFVRFITTDRSFRKIFILAHSMGGLVTLHFVTSTTQHIDGLILIAPMLKINTGIWPHVVAYAMANILDWAGWGDEYVIGHGDYVERHFKDNPLTNSKVRFDFGRTLFRVRPELIISGVSNHWLITAMDYTEKIRDLRPKISKHILLFQAGDDQFVINSAQDEFCAMVEHCKKILYDNAKHELLMEVDAVRNSVLEKAEHFILQGQDY